MPPAAFPAVERSTRRAIVKLLKTEGAMDSTRLAKRLRLTPMAVRQHLYALQREKLVTADERPVPIGRPAKHWRLTRESDRLFPDAYAELNVALIDAVGSTFGPTGPAARDRVARGEAARGVRPAHRAVAPLKERLQQLARVRTEEGYMAEVRPDGPRAPSSSSRIIARSARRRRPVRASARRSSISSGACWAPTRRSNGPSTSCRATGDASTA